MWGAVLGVATVLGLFFAAQMHYASAAFGRSVSWGQALYWALGDWYEWAILSPLIFWLSHRFSFDRRRWRSSFGIHFIAGVVLSVAHLLLCGLAEQLQGWVQGNSVSFSNSFQRLFTNRFHFNLAVYALIVCAWHAWAYYRKYREREAQAVELAGQLAQAQLQALRMQLNPHFLFNTLHAVSSLMLKDVVAANRMITRLGELLRLSLETTDQQEVSLREELEFLRRYFEIEKIRFEDRLAVRMDIEPATLDAAVPNLILQPLVENAIRYAIEPNPAPGQIKLSAVRNNGQLVLQVSDNGAGGSSQETRSKINGTSVNREGIGLSNTRQRLQQLYGENQRLELKPHDTGGLLVSITIPFHTKADQTTPPVEKPAV
jgi:signal transduction histidine kinase